MPKIFDFSRTRIRWQYLDCNLEKYLNLKIEERKNILDKMNVEQQQQLVKVLQIFNQHIPRSKL